nr:VOC family protein [Selenomonas sputigena]
MNIKYIDHIVITTQDLAQCLAFYEGVLGMEHRERDGRHALHFGNAKFNIHVQKGEFQPAAKHPTCGSLDLCLIADGSIDDIQRELEANTHRTRHRRAHRRKRAHRQHLSARSRR